MHAIRHHKQQGFTLIEAVVASALFAFVVTSMLGIYTSTLKLDARTRAERAVNENGRFIMEFFAKEVTNGHIDYASYQGGLATTTNEIYLINQGLESEHIYLSGNNLVLTKIAGTTNLNSSTVRVTRAQFLVSPAGDPFTPAKTYNEQPHVTVILQLTANYGAKDAIALNLQSTFSDLYYPSRE